MDILVKQNASNYARESETLYYGSPSRASLVHVDGAGNRGLIPRRIGRGKGDDARTCRRSINRGRIHHIPQVLVHVIRDYRP